ncbi:MAG: hypothetical protein JWQ58_2328, partial [Reyranella sp.]|nr:hypothetical protein [Reyranella sp.]
RGGISVFNVDQKETMSIFVFGISMTVGAGGKIEIVTRPGFQVTTLFGTLPGRAGAVPPGSMSALLGQLEGGKSGSQSGGADQSAKNSGFSDSNSGQGSGKTLGDRFGSGPGPRNTNPNNTTISAITQANDTAPSLQPDISKVNTMRSTVTYTGSMAGLVRNNGRLSFGTGSYNQAWSFGSNSGTTTANFNNSNYSGTTNRNGAYGFNSSLSSTTNPGRNMSMTGVFLPGQGDPTKNQAGVFTVNGPNYQAGGIFAGTKQ